MSREGKVEIKYHLLRRKYFKESFTFQSKCCILKKVLHCTESFIYQKESFIIKQKVLLL